MWRWAMSVAYANGFESSCASLGVVDMCSRLDIRDTLCELKLEGGFESVSPMKIVNGE